MQTTFTTMVATNWVLHNACPEELPEKCRAGQGGPPKYFHSSFIFAFPFLLWESIHSIPSIKLFRMASQTISRPCPILWPAVCLRCPREELGNKVKVKSLHFGHNLLYRWVHSPAFVLIQRKLEAREGPGTVGASWGLSISRVLIGRRDLYHHFLHRHN